MGRNRGNRKKINAVFPLKDSVFNQSDCRDVEGSLDEKHQQVSPHDDFRAAPGLLHRKENLVDELENHAHNNEAGVDRSLKKKLLAHTQKPKNGIHEGNRKRKNGSAYKKGRKEKRGDLPPDFLHVARAKRAGNQNSARNRKCRCDRHEHFFQLVYEAYGGNGVGAHVCGNESVNQLEKLSHARIKDKGQGNCENGLELAPRKHQFPAFFFFFTQKGEVSPPAAIRRFAPHFRLPPLQGRCPRTPEELTTDDTDYHRLNRKFCTIFSIFARFCAFFDFTARMSSFGIYLSYQKTASSRENGLSKSQARLLHAVCACNYIRLSLTRQHKLSVFVSRFSPSRLFLHKLTSPKLDIRNI